MSKRILTTLVLVVSTLMLASCMVMKTSTETIRIETIAAQKAGTAKRMVIVWPGYGDDLAALKRSGIASVIQSKLPDAEVVLVELPLPYLMQGRGVRRLHEEIVSPAKQRGFRDIYFAGASMGGMGVLLYEREYPNEMRGLILMAPFMGDPAVMKEVEAAGGLAQWNPGPAPEQLSRNNMPREECTTSIPAFFTASRTPS